MERYTVGCRVAVVIVNETFSAKAKIPTRIGADRDYEMLCSTLPKIGFHIIHNFWNVTATEILSKMKKVAKELPDDVECFACFISSHGTKNDESEEYRKDLVYGTDGAVEIGQLMEPFYDKNCPELKDKPKLFFIQAGRGEKLDYGVLPPGSAESESARRRPIRSHSPPPDGRPEDMPLRRDFLLSCSSPPGYIAFTNETTGSWFIRIILEVFETRCHEMDVMYMLTMVNRKMGQVVIENKEDTYTSGCVLSAWTSSMLRKEVYFGNPIKLD